MVKKTHGQWEDHEQHTMLRSAHVTVAACLALLPAAGHATCAAHKTLYQDLGCCPQTQPLALYNETAESTLAFACSSTKGFHRVCCENGTAPRGHIALQDFPAFRWLAREFVRNGYHVSFDGDAAPLVAAAKLGPATVYSMVKVTQQNVGSILSQAVPMPSLDGTVDDDLLIRAGGRVVGAKYLTNAMHMVYRRDIFEALQLSYPQTFEQLAATTLPVLKQAGYPTPMGLVTKNGWNMAYTWVQVYAAATNRSADALFQPVDGVMLPDRAALRASIGTIRTLLPFCKDVGTVDSAAAAADFVGNHTPVAWKWASRIKPLVGAFGEAALRLAGGLQYEGKTRVASAKWWDGLVNLQPDTALEAVVGATMRSAFYEDAEALAAATWVPYRGANVPFSGSGLATVLREEALWFEGALPQLHAKLMAWTPQLLDTSYDVDVLVGDVFSGFASSTRR